MKHVSAAPLNERRTVSYNERGARIRTRHWEIVMGQVINRLKAADFKRTAPGVFADGNGLYLRITEGKEGICRSWIYRYSRDEYITSTRKDGTQYRRQKEGVVGLGPHPQVSLEDARAAAREIDRKRRSGEDRDPAK